MDERGTFDTVYLQRRASDWSPAWKEVGSPLGPGAQLKSPGESQSLSGAVVGSGLVARGLSWHESCLLAFLLDAQPDLTPAPPARAQQACPPRGFTELREHGSRSSRRGSPGFLHQCLSSTRAHSSTHGERRLAGRPVAALSGPLLPQHPRPRGAPTAMEVLESGEQSVLQWDRKLSELSEPGETEALMYHTVRTHGPGQGGLEEKGGCCHQLETWDWKAASRKGHGHNKRSGDGSFPL